MSRAIDDDALIQAMCKLCNQEYSDDPCEPSDCIFMGVIKEAPTLTPPNEWVSVEERLPRDEQTVLVFIGYADTMTGFITTSFYFCFDANPHWQCAWYCRASNNRKTQGILGS